MTSQAAPKHPTFANIIHPMQNQQQQTQIQINSTSNQQMTVFHQPQQQTTNNIQILPVQKTVFFFSHN